MNGSKELNEKNFTAEQILRFAGNETNEMGSLVGNSAIDPIVNLELLKDIRNKYLVKSSPVGSS
jgi:hypothetical protein